MARTRFWPVPLIGALALLWLAKTWWTGEEIRQMRVMSTLAALGAAVLAMLIWLLFLSRLPRRTRLAGLGVVLAASLAFVLLFRIRGVTGDLVPIVDFRWARRQQPPAVRSPPPPSPSVPRDDPGSRPSPGEPPPSASIAPDTAPASKRAPAASAATPAASSGDYPQFLGPDRNGVVRGIRLARDWSARPPRRLWRQPIGAGWAPFSVSGDAAVTQEQRGEEEVVVRYELRTGRPAWLHADRALYSTVIAGTGPRSAPTIAGARVYTMGATGILNALELDTGKRVWSKDVLAENGAANLDWGRSCSPLVIGDLVVVSAGGSAGRSLVAYHAATGERVWSGGDQAAAYASPVLVELAGREQILIFNHGSVAAHDPQTGAVLWEHPWPPSQPNVAQPLPLPGDRVLFSAGYGIGSKVFQVARREDGGLSATLAWESPRLKAKFTNLVFHDGYVYGLDDGVLACLDPATGERVWKSGRYGHGQVLLVEDLLLVQTEEGEIALVEPSPRGHHELTRFAALEGKTWNPPALAGSLLLVRNDREAACYEMPVER